jgi:hypothetical protein
MFKDMDYVTRGEWYLELAGTGALCTRTSGMTRFASVQPLSAQALVPLLCTRSARQTWELLSALVADGIITVKRAFYKCGLCQQVVGQAPSQFLSVGAWPGSMSSSHLKTVYDQRLLQLWDSHWLHNPQSSMSGFLKGIAHAAREAHGTVRSTQLPGPLKGLIALLLGSLQSRLHLAVANMHSAIAAMASAWHHCLQIFF